MEPDDDKGTDESDAARRRAELDRELSKGEHPLPENKPRGLLGGAGLDLRQPDSDRPSLFGGVTQEIDANLVWVAMLIAFLVFFPAAYVILWWYPRFPKRMKIGYTVAFTVIIALVVLALSLGWIRLTG